MTTKNSVVVDCKNLTRKQKASQQENLVSEVLHDYCSSSTIHGIGYIGAKDKSLVEKIWWIIVVILSLIMCSYLISRTWIKWQNSPVILSFEEQQTPIWKIPFPAVTICPANKIQQFLYNYTEMFLKRDELEGEEQKKFWDISLGCNLEEYETPFNCSLNFTDKDALENIRNAAPTLELIIAEVKWQGKKFISETRRQVFSEQITQEGICFTFNSFSQDDMYTKEVDHDLVFINHTVKNSGWKLEDGYPPDTSALNNHPRRTAKDGYGSGLTIYLYHFPKVADYVCGRMMSGYKILLHNPAETPRPKQQYFLIPLKRKLSFTVKPELTTTSENLRSMSPNARKCYFSNEKSLRFFNVYTQSNCRIECSVNVTQQICGCVPFYMPHDEQTQICAYGRMECVFEAEAKILDFEMIEAGVNASSDVRETETYKIFEKCNCQPSCSDIQYSAEASHTESHIAKSLVVSGLLNESAEIEALESELVVLTEVDIFFKESQFLALHRSELYGQTDFLANCGGLLGLFMGFSLLSLIEIIYFMTIRLWLKWKNTENTKL